MAAQFPSLGKEGSGVVGGHADAGARAFWHARLLEMFVSDVKINGMNSLKSFRINKSFKNELKTNWFS